MTYDDLIGKPYQDGGRGPDAYDCWGLAIEIHRRFGIDLPDFDISAKACEQIHNKIIDQSYLNSWQEIEAPKMPCLILFKAHPRFVQHVGTFIGYGRFLHIREYGVAIERVLSPLWNKRIRGFWEYVD